MKTITLCRFLVIAGLAALTVTAQTPSLPELKKPFEAGVRAAQQQQREQVKAASDQYLAALKAAEQRFQESGAEAGLAWVRAERQRFEQAGDMPESALGSGQLRQAQTAWQAQVAQAKLAHAQRTAGLTGTYLQDLARLQFQLADNPAGLAEIKDETERVLNNSAIREALALAKAAKPATAPAVAPAAEPAAASAKPPAEPAEPAKPAPATAARPLTGTVTVGDYKFYPLGKEPPAKELKQLRLEFPNVASRSAASAYGLGAGVYADKEKMDTNRQSGIGFAYKQERGSIRTTARITVACHGRDLAEGSKLTVHYFSHPANSLMDFREERIELIALPAVPHGQTVVVDGAGIELGKFEHHGVRKVVKGGDEFYGLIVSLFDPDGKLLIQQCSSTALAKTCPASLPAEKQQEALSPRFGGGKP